MQCKGHFRFIELILRYRNLSARSYLGITLLNFTFRRFDGLKAHFRHETVDFDYFLELLCGGAEHRWHAKTLRSSPTRAAPKTDPARSSVETRRQARKTAPGAPRKIILLPS
jgi:hypothetical protein